MFPGRCPDNTQMACRLKAQAEETSTPNPTQITQEQLGPQTKRRADTEIDDLLKEIDNEMRRALLERLPFERVLTKVECLRMLQSFVST